ncbi:MAG: NAD(P) transhydrogenase subunit alpha [Bacteroidales bacterium]|nr:NAD(P) transhydrogenase subunit alpha [Bacteroidales bacterium]
MDAVIQFLYAYHQEIFIVVLATFLGFELIASVPSVLHTPLMSGANAISGVVIVGAIIYVGHATDWLNILVGSIALFMATLNVTGGFVVTDRMLEMFKKKKTKE